MGTIKLEGKSGCSATLISNRFLDEYMPNANGEFVKIYLYLLRALSSPDMEISVCHIADIFNHTEKDVIRALKYWEQIGLLELGFNSDKIITNICMKPLVSDYMTTDGTNIEISTFSASKSQALTHIHKEITSGAIKPEIPAEPVKAADSNTEQNHVNNNSSILQTKLSADSVKQVITASVKPAKKVYTADEIDAFNEKSDVIEFLYLAQKYIGKPLSGTDVNTLLYFYDILGFEADLIEYLIEYCITNGHKSLRYMEKVAITWADEGINTVELARANTELYSSSCYPVLKAFGLSGRNPGEGEKALIIKWTNSYGFTMDIILDACNRTMNAIHQPSFEYADSILSKWKERGIRTLSDIKVLDGEHQKNKTAYNKNHTDSKPENSSKSKNTFNDFNQRTYNYESLEKELLNNI